MPFDISFQTIDDNVWLRDGAALATALAVAVLVHIVVFGALRRFARRSDTAVSGGFVRRIARPTWLLLPLLSVQFALPATSFASGETRELLRHVLGLLTVFAVVWMLIATIRGTAGLIKSRYDVAAADNYAARRMHTQVNLIARTIIALVVVIGLGLALMTFPRIREVGTSLLASAGVAGLIIGFASRPVLENLIAGVQLALTQPINIDDVVVIDGEWGRIEQITSTYVVVRIWDDRRLICPLSKFISESFQNWTRRTADILGTVFIYADYALPVDAVREELKRIVDGHPKWDGRVAIVQVTDSTPRAMELRVLVSARSGPAAWDLRVDVRERLIAFLQRAYPTCLPRARVELQPAEDGDSTAKGAAAV
jgi:small-conductance mechanosensitive channel